MFIIVCDDNYNIILNTYWLSTINIDITSFYKSMCFGFLVFPVCDMGLKHKYDHEQEQYSILIMICVAMLYLNEQINNHYSHFYIIQSFHQSCKHNLLLLK